MKRLATEVNSHGIIYRCKIALSWARKKSKSWWSCLIWMSWHLKNQWRVLDRSQIVVLYCWRISKVKSQVNQKLTLIMNLWLSAWTIRSKVSTQERQEVKTTNAQIISRVKSLLQMEIWMTQKLSNSQFMQLDQGLL